MTDELKAACERLRRLDSAQNMTTEDWEVTYGAGGGFKYDVEDDKWTLTRAYLAEHPADDAEPVTEEWLLAEGWEPTREGGPHWYIRGGAGVLWDRRENELMIDNSTTGWHLVARPSTRGQVRRLLHALGQGEGTHNGG